MRKSMKIFSKLSKNNFSPETEELVKDVLSRAIKFKEDTDDILSKYQQPIVIGNANRVIENIFLKFHLVVKEINERYNTRSTLEVNDEYDVQDLLHGLLRLYFDDIRPEEWTPSYAGTSSRMDFLLKNEQVVIEVKMIRKGLGKKRLAQELIIDKAYYKGHPDCKTLCCLVYDPKEKISNPRGFEKDLNERIGDFDTKVFIVPRI